MTSFTQTAQQWIMFFRDPGSNVIYSRGFGHNCAGDFHDQPGFMGCIHVSLDTEKMQIISKERGLLREMLELKQIKDKHGKTAEYLKRKAICWERVKEMLGLGDE